MQANNRPLNKWLNYIGSGLTLHQVTRLSLDSIAQLDMQTGIDDEIDNYSMLAHPAIGNLEVISHAE